MNPLLTLMAVAAFLAESDAGAAPPRDFLGATRLIDVDAPAIRATAERLTAHATTPREKALRIHDFVRDEIRFGWTRDFYDLPASGVLEAGVGYCTTKATLFIALLRAAGIPARQHFVALDPGVLRGFVERPQPLDHAFSEVHLDGRWIAVDSYVVDAPLFERARTRLAQEGRPLGWGIHADGTPDWDGRAPAFSQFVEPGLASRDYGIFADAEAFYAAGRRNDELRGVQGVMIRLLIGHATRRVEAVREGEAS